MAPRSWVATPSRAPTRSPSSIGSTTCASGSPKRALNSSTIGPDSVSIRPAYRTPRYGTPSRAMSQAIGSKTLPITASSASLPKPGTGA